MGQQESLKILLDEETANGEYVNFANIVHSGHEFVIDFGRIVPGKDDVKVFTRVIMTPATAVSFLDALGQNVAIFKKKLEPEEVPGTEN